MGKDAGSIAGYVISTEKDSDGWRAVCEKFPALTGRGVDELQAVTNLGNKVVEAMKHTSGSGLGVPFPDIDANELQNMGITPLFPSRGDGGGPTSNEGFDYRELPKEVYEGKDEMEHVGGIYSFSQHMMTHMIRASEAIEEGRGKDIIAEYGAVHSELSQLLPQLMALKEQTDGWEDFGDKMQEDHDHEKKLEASSDD